MKKIDFPRTRPIYPLGLRTSRVKARWSAGEPALCTIVQLADATIPELIGGMGFDCIWIDLEHSPMSLETAANLIRAARQSDCDVLARPGKGEFMRMGRLLEAGANGILYPRCESVAEAREVVRWSKFAPQGERGYAGGNADAGYGMHGNRAAYLEGANRETFICLQIESPSAVKKARAIAEVEGVDLLFFGPGDYSILSGVQRDNPIVWKACQEVAKAALAASKRFGTVTSDKESVSRLLNLGATFLHHGADIDILGAGFQNIRKYLGELGFRFGRHQE